MLPLWIFGISITAIIVQTLIELNFERLDRLWARKTSGVVPPNLAASVTPEAHRKSAEYSIEHSVLGTKETVYGLGLRLILLFSGLIPLIYGATLHAFGPTHAWAFAGMMALVSIVMGILHWPFDWQSTFGIEAKYGFNKTTPGTWWADNFRSMAIGLVLTVPLTAAVLWLAGHLRDWWLITFVILSAYELVLTWVWPNWISPLFNKFSPLPDGPLKSRLDELSRKAGLTFEKILVMDGSRRSGHANAYFTGLGKSRRIVLYDTLINQLDTEEVAAVLAHEIGHEKHKHIIRGIYVSSAWQLTGLCLANYILLWPDFYAAFGLHIAGGVAGGFWLMSLVAGPWFIWMTPMMALFSRGHEYQADAYAASLIGSSTPLVTGLRKMTRESLASVESHPATHAFYASHPTLMEREAALAKWEFLHKAPDALVTPTAENK